MDTKKTIAKYKLISIVVIVIYILFSVALVLLEEDVFQLIAPNSSFQGINFWIVFLIAGVLVMAYFGYHILIQNMIVKILREQCLPKEYREVYLALTPKRNLIGISIVNMTTDFMMGNFEAAKVRCYEALQTSKHIAVRQNAYSILAQIYLITEDVDNLIRLRETAMIGTKHQKYGMVYQRIVNSASAFIDFLRGETSVMLGAYSRSRELCKTKSDLYISLFYYALALVKNGNIEQAIPIFEELITKANGLFVSNFSKLALITIVTE